jgi:tetratricopeptide (TPR) repeat protein
VVYEFENNLYSAEIKYQAAFEIKKILKDTIGLAYAYSNLAGIAKLKKDFAKAIELIKKSTEIREQINELNDLGRKYCRQRLYFFFHCSIRQRRKRLQANCIFTRFGLFKK